MVDFLKANPFVSMNDYMYKLSIAKIQLMSSDFTHVEYLTEKQAERKKELSRPVKTLSDFIKR